MQFHRFGATARDVSRSSDRAPGTSSYGDTCASRSPRCAGHRPRHDAYRYRRDVRLRPVEEIVGEAIAGRRDEVFLVSKVLPQNASPRRDASRPASARSRASRPTGWTATSCTGAARTRWRTRSPPSRSCSDEGKILLLGRQQLRRAPIWRRRAAIAGAGRIACNQVLYHLKERAIEHAVLPWCEEHGVAVVGYSPFRPGRLPRRGHSRRAGAGRDRRGPRRHAAAGRPRLPHPVARGLRHPKASRPAHVEENAGAGDLRLQPDQIARLDQAFRRGARPRSLPMI